MNYKLSANINDTGKMDYYKIKERKKEKKRKNVKIFVTLQ